jgi:hypothetical protein
MSTAAPAMSSPLSPSSGIRRSPASATPTIDPSVLMPYTSPIAFSPAPEAISIRVMIGSVIPAQNVAGSMTASDIPYRLSEYIR